MSGDYVVRTMSAAERERAIGWAAAEGWNPGLHDATTFATADASGFLVGVLDGEPIASISVVRYGATFAFLGLYIVVPGQRGQGYGWRLWQAGMATLVGRNVGLDGVVAQQDNYRKSGFVLAHRNVRYAGRGLASAVCDPQVVSVSALPYPALLQYDRAFFADDRDAFLQAWVTQRDATALAFVRDGSIRGYGVLRRCREGHKIGPLFADSPDIAQTLFTALAGTVPTQEGVYLDVPETNADAVALAVRHGMQPSFETARMYTRGAPPLPLARTYGITTFELG
ncbi:MAG: GNAT family N-acetyltransferase [Burkholderiales bacterium]